MSQLKTNSIVDASGGNTATINGVAPNVNNIRGKNAIINGNFDVWQRGTGAFTASTNYTADRWLIQHLTSAQSISQSSFTLGQTDVPNEPKHYLTSTVTTGGTAGSYALVQQRIESVRTLAGQTATLSFWAKADAAKDIATELIQTFGTGGGSAGVTALGVATLSLTTSWQKFEVTVAIPSISGKSIGTDNNDFLAVYFWFDAGSDYNARTNSLGNQSGTFDIAQVQLEAGDTASGFETLSYGETLAMCQRYYQFWAASVADASTEGRFLAVQLQTPMRATPTLTRVADLISSAEAGTTVTSASNSSYYLSNTSTAVGGTGTADAEL